MKAHLLIATGGRIAEEMIFGKDKITNGAASDIQMVTNLAKKMVWNLIIWDQYLIAISKLFIMKINRNKTLGASSIVDSAETVGKWDITASAISSLQLINSANNWTTDSYISVWGHD